MKRFRKVFVTGTYDIVHKGHVEFLKFAAEQGDWLLVAIDKDSRVREKKGDSRPINNENDRRAVIKAIRYVDDVCFFASDEELVWLLQNYKPDVWVAGSDWKNVEVPERIYAKEVVFFDRIPEYSTTGIIDAIIE